MTEAQMKQFAEDYPMRVDEHDTCGTTLLYRAAEKDNTSLVEWLVDEKGASVNCTREEGPTTLHMAKWGKTPLHVSKSPEMVSFLLARGADVAVLDKYGWTTLMFIVDSFKPSCVEVLLREPRVIETIDTQGTRECEVLHCKGGEKGDTALHLACKIIPFRRRSLEVRNEFLREKNQIIEMLLCAGASPTILNSDQKTPLDYLRRFDCDNHTGIALLERALAEPHRILILAKAREINDANHAIAKAKEDAQRKVLAATPACLRERVREQQQQQQLLYLPRLPRVELHGPPPAAHARPGSEEEEEAKKRHATLQYVLRTPELGKTGGMSADVFVELMEMMTPRWDPIRRAEGGGEGEGQGSGSA
jgi:ankyrin repeat protein